MHAGSTLPVLLLFPQLGMSHWGQRTEITPGSLTEDVALPTADFLDVSMAAP